MLPANLPALFLNEGPSQDPSLGLPRKGVQNGSFLEYEEELFSCFDRMPKLPPSLRSVRERGVLVVCSDLVSSNSIDSGVRVFNVIAQQRIKESLPKSPIKIDCLHPGPWEKSLIPPISGSRFSIFQPLFPQGRNLGRSGKLPSLEPIPAPISISLAVARFIPTTIAGTASPLREEETPHIEKNTAQFRQHVVKEGESLWKIARQYSVKVDEIVRINEMEKDRLYPGMILRIP